MKSIKLVDMFAKMGGLSAPEVAELKSEFNRLLPRKSNVVARMLNAEYKRTPKIAVIGSTGAGKSSTINALFSPNPPLPVGDVLATTKEIHTITINLNERGSIQIFDCPGIGEDYEVDQSYAEQYRALLEKVDIALWVIQADDRNYSHIQNFIKDEFSETIKKRIVIGINQIDKFPPYDWVDDYNRPSISQEEKIDTKIRDVKKKFEKVGVNPLFVVPYSAMKKYKLGNLFSLLLKSCPEKAWVVNSRKKIANSDGITTNNSDEVFKKVLLDLGDKIIDLETRLENIENNNQKKSKKSTASTKRPSRKKKNIAEELPSFELLNNIRTGDEPASKKSDAENTIQEAQGEIPKEDIVYYQKKHKEDLQDADRQKKIQDDISRKSFFDKMKSITKNLSGVMHQTARAIGNIISNVASAVLSEAAKKMFWQ